MLPRKLIVSASLFIAAALSAKVACALGFEVNQTKEQLKLKYDVSVVDHHTGRVTVCLTLEDEGRLAPLERGVQLVIPAKDETGVVDLSVTLIRSKIDGKQVGSVHIRKDWAERAEIHLCTESLDGKQLPLTWYYHRIKLADYLKEIEKK